MKTEHIFIDTNGFIQFFDLQQLNWKEALPDAEEIIVLVSGVVIEELDQHKNSSNQRRRDRARSALRMIEAASEQVDLMLLLRQKAPKVILKIHVGPRPDWESLPDLDPSRNDDKLVADAITFNTERKNALSTLEGSATILSHDTGPRIRARIAKLTAIAPPKGWLLPPDKSDDQIKVKALERALANAQNAKPQLTLRVTTELEDDAVTFPKTLLPPLGSDLVSRLSEIYLSQHSMIHLSPSSQPAYLIQFGGGMSYLQSDVDNYERAFKAFEYSVPSFFESLHETLSHRCDLFSINYLIENIGSISAKDFICDVRVTGDFVLLRDRKDGEEWVRSLNPPKVPPIPKKKRAGFPYFDEERLLQSMRRQQAIAAVDRPKNATEMKWINRPEDNRCRYGCDDFRPGRTYEDEVVLYANGVVPHSGEVLLEISSEHHATITHRIKIHAIEQEAKWKDLEKNDGIPLSLRTILAEGGVFGL
tara:strand:- start:1579 stop:3009 length:1431 start_codon:yes stop_codon:yes gene_type:complete